MMVSRYELLIKECESDLRAGRIDRCGRRLAALNLARVPRQWRLPLANLCRRVDLLSLGLKLLSPLVLASHNRLKSAPSAEELAEYAILLQKSGSVNEALRILDQVPADRVPQALLYRAFCHFNRWEYERAIGYLSAYQKHALSPYSKLLGQVNLAAALAMTRRHAPAMEILRETLMSARAGSHHRLEANALELMAQVHIQMGALDQARAALDHAARILGDARVYDNLFVRKWQAVLQASSLGHAGPLLQLKADARRMRLWETYREADLQILKIAFEPELHRHLLFGTPFAAHRSRVSEELGVEITSTHASFGDAGAPCLDIESGDIDGRAWLKPGSKIHQVLEVLARDFYKPMNVGSLFSELFPEEYFDIFSSPDRVHQVLRRSRSLLKSSGVAIKIVESYGAYSLEMGEGLSLRVPLQRVAANWFEIHMRRLQARLQPGLRMSGASIKSGLDFTEAEYKRFLKWTLAENRLKRVGSGSHVAYMIGSSPTEPHSSIELKKSA